MTEFVQGGGVVTTDGPTDGAILTGWLASRFDGNPAYNQAPPEGDPDVGPVTSGDPSQGKYGGPGRWMLTFPTVAGYWVSVVLNNNRTWAYYDLAALGGVQTLTLSLNGAGPAVVAVLYALDYSPESGGQVLAALQGDLLGGESGQGYPVFASVNESGVIIGFTSVGATGGIGGGPAGGAMQSFDGSLNRQPNTIDGLCLIQLDEAPGNTVLGIDAALGMVFGDSAGGFYQCTTAYVSGDEPVDAVWVHTAAGIPPGARIVTENYTVDPATDFIVGVGETDLTVTLPESPPTGVPLIVWGPGVTVACSGEDQIEITGGGGFASSVELAAGAFVIGYFGDGEWIAANMSGGGGGGGIPPGARVVTEAFTVDPTTDFDIVVAASGVAGALPAAPSTACNLRIYIGQGASTTLTPGGSDQLFVVPAMQGSGPSATPQTLVPGVYDVAYYAYGGGIWFIVQSLEAPPADIVTNGAFGTATASLQTNPGSTIGTVVIVFNGWQDSGEPVAVNLPAIFEDDLQPTGAALQGYEFDGATPLFPSAATLSGSTLTVPSVGSTSTTGTITLTGVISHD